MDDYGNSIYGNKFNRLGSMESAVSVLTVSTAPDARTVSTLSARTSQVLTQTQRTGVPTSSTPMANYCQKCFSETHSSPYFFLQNTKLSKKLIDEDGKYCRTLQK